MQTLLCALSVLVCSVHAQYAVYPGYGLYAGYPAASYQGLKSSSQGSQSAQHKAASASLSGAGSAAYGGAAHSAYSLDAGSSQLGGAQLGTSNLGLYGAGPAYGAWSQGSSHGAGQLDASSLGSYQSAYSADASHAASLGAAQLGASSLGHTADAFSGAAPPAFSFDTAAASQQQSTAAGGASEQKSGGAAGGDGEKSGGGGATDPTHSSEAAWAASRAVTKAYAIRMGKTTLPTSYLIPLDSDLDNYVAVPVPEGKGTLLYYFETFYGPSNCSTANTYCAPSPYGANSGQPCFTTNLDVPDYSKKQQCDTLFEDKDGSCKVKVSGTYDSENQRGSFKAVIDFCKGQDSKKKA